MPYIGNQSTNSYSSMVKQDLTGASGASVTLSHPVANANEVELYINNVRQEPTTSYTTSGTTLSFVNYTVAASDDIYVIFLGKALQTTVPPDGSVSTAKIADSAVDLTSKVTGVLPLANGGTGATSFAEANSVIETFYYGTGDHTEGNNSNLDEPWTRLTTNSTANKNGGMSASGGWWTFPSTGIWNITLSFVFYDTQASNSSGVLLMHSPDGGSNFNAVHGGYQAPKANNAHAFITLPHTFNITNTTNERLLYRITSGGNLNVRGGSSWNSTKVTFIKLCPSV